MKPIVAIYGTTNNTNPLIYYGKVMISSPVDGDATLRILSSDSSRIDSSTIYEGHITISDGLGYYFEQGNSNTSNFAKGICYAYEASDKNNYIFSLEIDNTYYPVEVLQMLT